MPTRANVQAVDTGATPAGSLTYSNYTPSAGSNRVLEVAVGFGRDGVAATAGVTFGGVAMTQRVVIGGGSNVINASIFTLNEADWPATPADIVVTLNGTGGIRLVASTIADVDQTTPMDVTPTTFGGTGDINPWSLAITTATDLALISTFGGGNDLRTYSSVGSGQSAVSIGSTAVEVAGAFDLGRTLLWEREQATAGAETMTATWSGGFSRLAIVGVAYRPASAGGPSPAALAAYRRTQLLMEP